MKRIWEQNWPDQEPLIPPLPAEPIFEQIRKQARANPEKTAINFYGREVTFRELDEASDRFATALVKLGVKKGDRVALYFENCPQFVIAFYGILKMGGIVANCSPMYKADELEHELRDAGVETIVMEDFFYPVLESIRERCNLKNVIVTTFADYLPEKPAFPLHPSMSTV
ncbi:MAG: AMP-binding protein, partial [Desulfotomaculales bacterium]